jgi:hypothetical protein
LAMKRFHSDRFSAPLNLGAALRPILEAGSGVFPKTGRTHLLVTPGNRR